MAISKRLRYEVLRRDNFACRYCGAAAPDVVLAVDHVVPRALGGQDEASNLVAACVDCNAGKSTTTLSHPPVEDVPQVNLRLVAGVRAAVERHKERETEIRHLTWDLMRTWDITGLSVREIHEYDAWRPGMPDLPSSPPMPDIEELEEEIRDWFRAGLDLTVLENLLYPVRLSMKIPDDQKWGVFTAKVYALLRQLQAEAREALINEGLTPSGGS